MTSQLNTVQPSRSSANLFASDSSDAEILAFLERGRARAAQEAAGFEGILTPGEVFDLLAGGPERVVDVRTLEERKFVGYIADSISAPWAIGTALTRNPHFIRELERRAGNA